MSQLSGEVTVDVFAIQTAHEGDRALLEDETQPVVTDTDAVILSSGIETFEIWNLLKRPGGFHLFDGFFDPAQNSGTVDAGQVFIEGPPELRVHAAPPKR